MLASVDSNPFFLLYRVTKETEDIIKQKINRKTLNTILVLIMI